MKNKNLLLLYTIVACLTLHHLQGSGQESSDSDGELSLVDQFKYNIRCDNFKKINNLLPRVQELTAQDRNAIKEKSNKKRDEYAGYIHGSATVILPTLKEINSNHPRLALEKKIQEKQIIIHDYYTELSLKLEQE